MCAMYNGDTEIVKLLLEQPTVDLNCTDISGQTALHKAAWNDNGEAVKKLKMLLADPRLTTHNQKDDSGWTPAMMAAYRKRAGFLRELVAHPSVDLDIKDQNGRSLEDIARWDWLLNISCGMASLSLNSSLGDTIFWLVSRS